MAHKKGHNDLDPAFVKEIFNYSPTTGLLTWRISLARRAPVGRIAGVMDDQGRIKIGIKNKEYFAHRIIWVWMTGKWPEFEIDHRDEIKSNNKWNNLREATASQNKWNCGAPSHNKSGFKGVCFDNTKKKWLATINKTKDGKKHHIHIGWFETPEAAHAAYCKAAIRIHGEDWAHF